MATTSELNPSNDAIGADGLMTVRQVADFLRVCDKTIEALIRSGQLPRVRVGRRGVRIPRRSVVSYASRLIRTG